MYLNETYSGVCVGKNLSDKFSYPKLSKIRECFITTTFQLCFKICQKESPEKPGGTEIEWDTSASGLC
jgi:hypothetical protein